MEVILDFVEDFMLSFSGLYDFLVTPIIDIGDFVFTPAMFFTLDALLIFLTAAIVKWVVA